MNKKILVLCVSCLTLFLAACGQQEPPPQEPTPEPSAQTEVQGPAPVENPDGSVTVSTPDGEKITMGGKIPYYDSELLEISLDFPEEWQDKLWINDCGAGYIVVGKLAPGEPNTTDPFASLDGELFSIQLVRTGQSYDEYLKARPDASVLMENRNGTMLSIPAPPDGKCLVSDSKEEQEIYTAMLEETSKVLDEVKDFLG